MRAALLVVLFLLTGFPAHAAPMDPALQKQLIELQAAYMKAAGAGDFKKALAMMPAERRKAFEGDLKTARQRKEAAEMIKGTTPDSFDVTHAELSADGNEAEIEGLAKIKLDPRVLKQMPSPPTDGIGQSEMTYSFVKEKGEWKYVTRTFGPDPRDIKVCDPKWEGIEAYDRAKDTSAGGMIRRVAFEKDHILIVVRIVDEENCLFLPPREEIEKGGFDASLLAPRAIVEIEASPHRTDSRKMWVEGLDVKR